MTTASHRFVYLHGFGVGPKGVKFAFMSQYLGELGYTAETIAWHQPSYAETKLSESIKLVASFLFEEYQSSGKTWNVVGSSTGALIALQVARQYPECINKLLLLSPAINLRGHFEQEAEKLQWSAENPSAIDQVKPNYTGDESGSLGISFLEDIMIPHSDIGIAIAPVVPTCVVHAEADELVPVEDCRLWCTAHAKEQGGHIEHAHFLPLIDNNGNIVDHGLYHFAKPDATLDVTFEGVLRNWFS